MRKYICIFLTFFLYNECKSQCMFPKFLYDQMKDGKPRTWITETRFMENSPDWETQLEITVDPTTKSDITAKLRGKIDCYGTDPCFRYEVLYTRKCIREFDGKYVVQHNDQGRSYYTCVKFIEVNRNVVLSATGVEQTEPSSDLCADHYMEKDEWPWLSPVHEQWSLCPHVGGYDFRTFMNDQRQKLCHKVWRPSRLESECIRGEGLKFSFPEKACSPFHKHITELDMQCWASWSDGDYQFIIASEVDKIPQFVLRFPQNINVRSGFRVDLYFSVVCTTNIDGQPTSHTNVHRTELKMNQGEPGLCYDESPDCVKFANAGKCSSSDIPLHEYANHCKKSCGLCNLLTSPRSECRFDSDFRKYWYLFEKDRLENVRIDGGRILFSKMGEYICKSKHYEKKHYKMFSYYENGCRPRYTCFNFDQENLNTLNFQISESSPTDKSFELCEFKDDPAPLGGLVRSREMKTLLPAKYTKMNSCGLEGKIAVNGTIAGGRKCSGTITDMDTFQCTPTPRLMITLTSCYDGYDHYQEFTCIAYINIDDGVSFLITSAVNERNYNCWIIRTWPERMSERPWKEAHMLERAQCGTEEDMDPAVMQKTIFSLYTNSDKKIAPCPKPSSPPKESSTVRPATYNRNPAPYNNVLHDDALTQNNTSNSIRFLQRLLFISLIFHLIRL